MTTENNIVLDWKQSVYANGNEKVADDGTKIVHTDPIVLTPEAESKWGNWKFKNLEGWWGWRGAKNLIQKDVAIEVTLELGKQNQNGKRYHNILTVEQTDEQPSSNVNPNANITSKEEWIAPNDPLIVPVPLQGVEDIGTSASIREQAFYNHLNPEILKLLPQNKQNALLSAYYDTAMTMMRKSVRDRAIEVSKQVDEETEEKVEEETITVNGVFNDVVEDSPSVAKAKELGGKVIENTADDNEEITDLPW